MRARRATSPSYRASSSPGRRGRATISAHGALVAGSWARVVFGTLVAVGKPPEGLGELVIWITDHAYHLRALTVASQTRAPKPTCGSGSAPQLAGTDGPMRSSTSRRVLAPVRASEANGLAVVDQREIADRVELELGFASASSAACTRAGYAVRPR